MKKVLAIFLFVSTIPAQILAPILFTPPAAPGPSFTAIVTGQMLGTLRSDYTGCVGWLFKVDTTPITVQTLARWVVSGNTQTHSVILTNASGTTLGSCTVNTSGAPVGYNYCTLGSPIALSASTAYFELSQETNGGDQWYNDDTSITTTAVVNAAFTNSAYGSIVNSTTCNAISAGTASNAFVPLNLTY